MRTPGAALMLFGCARELGDPDVRWQAAIDADLAASGARGIAFGIIEDGALVATYLAGDAADGRPLTAETRFRIGSVTKSMTAAAVLQRGAAGLSVDAPIADVVPGFSLPRSPGCQQALTPRHVLSHTGALFDFLEIEGDPGSSSLGDWVTEDLPGLFCWTEPGVLWNYSNTGYYLAGRVLEAHAGRPYVDVMRDDLFAPLGMDRTTFDNAEVAADGDFATAQTRDWTGSGEAREVEPESYDNGWARPAGYAWSTVPDLAAWVGFLLDGDPAVLPDAERAALTTPAAITWDGGARERYGFGWFVNDGVFSGGALRPVTLWSHGGNIPGFTAGIYVLPEQRRAAILLASGDYVAAPGLLATWLDAVPLPPPDGRAAPAWDDAVIPAILGSWRDPWNIGRTEIRQSEDGLTLRAPDLEVAGVPYERALTPTGANTVSWRVQNVTVPLTFVPDETGEIRWMRARFSVSERDDSPLPPPPDADRGRRIRRALGSAE